MKSLILALIIILCGSSYLWAQNPAANPPQAKRPKLVLTEKEFDAKLNPPGTSISHTFVVKNEGDDNLRLEVVPGCGCMVANYDKTIAPGESGSIVVTVDLYEAWAGRKVNKAVTVGSNDPDAPMTRLIIRAQVEPKSAAPKSDNPKLKSRL
ncbi:MAG: DUF1573 domain-containing protein [Deltaproteobacteria bacterium]|jgi:hypothetical protein|nr:DUF1573 domain-containing protein [Deltaproteobacteria bacterium]